MIDRGREQAYRAEAAAFGGSWYQDSCKIPVLSQEDFLELHNMAVEFCIRKGWASGARPVPKVSFSVRRSSVCFYSEIRYSTKRLCAYVAIHEVAHWACPSLEGHGLLWRSRYAILIEEFLGKEFADRFLQECRTQPIRLAAANRAPRRTFVVEKRPAADRNGTYAAVPWTVAPKDEAAIARRFYASRMRRGDAVLILSLNSWFRMTSDLP